VSGFWLVLLAVLFHLLSVVLRGQTITVSHPEDFLLLYHRNGDVYSSGVHVSIATAFRASLHVPLTLTFMHCTHTSLVGRAHRAAGSQKLFSGQDSALGEPFQIKVA